MAAALLEAAGPLSMVGAQAVYLGQPLLEVVISSDSLKAVARVLEDPQQTQALAQFLREASSQ